MIKYIMELETKRCTKCGETKPVTEFYYNKIRKKYVYNCRTCKQLISKKWSEKNKEYIKKYYEVNKKKINATSKNWYEKNKNRKKETNKNWYERNKNKVNKRNAKRAAQRMKTDINFKIKTILRNNSKRVIKGKYKTSSFLKLIGCTIPEFNIYFQSKFTEGMTWDKFMSGDIHIDHIIPCAAFDLTRDVDQQTCFHYTNLQPLWPSDNLRKHTSFDL